MVWAEPLDVFVSDFGTSCTLDGSPVRAVVDAATELEVNGALTTAPTALLVSAAAGNAQPNMSFSAAGVAYRVRQVLRQPPDGAMTRLVLVRA